MRSQEAGKGALVESCRRPPSVSSMRSRQFKGAVLEMPPSASTPAKNIHRHFVRADAAREDSQQVLEGLTQTLRCYFSRAASGQASIAIACCAPSISTHGLDVSTRRPY